MKPSDLLPGRDWYLKGTHPGTDVWRHARTHLTPSWPAWTGEGSRCTDDDCHGRRTTYKDGVLDTGLDTLEDYADSSTEPTPDSIAGHWICAVCFRQGAIALDEVRQHVNDVPQGTGRGHVVPLFGPTEIDRYSTGQASRPDVVAVALGVDSVDWAQTDQEASAQNEAHHRGPRQLHLRSPDDDISPDHPLDDGIGLSSGHTGNTGSDPVSVDAIHPPTGRTQGPA